MGVQKKTPKGRGSPGAPQKFGVKSGPKAGRFDQTNLIASGGEFPSLITLNDDSATRFDPDDPCPNPAKGGGFEHFHHVTGL